MPVGGDATLSVLGDSLGNDVTGYETTGTYYQNVVYYGSFKDITMATGTAILLYLGDQPA